MRAVHFFSAIVLLMTSPRAHSEGVNFKWNYKNPSPILQLFADYIDASMNFERLREKYRVSKDESDWLSAIEAKERADALNAKLREMKDAESLELVSEWVSTNLLPARAFIMRFFVDTGTKKEVVLNEFRRLLPKFRQDGSHQDRIVDFLDYLAQHGTTEDHKIILTFRDYPGPAASHARWLTEKLKLDNIAERDKKLGADFPAKQDLDGAQLQPPSLDDLEERHSLSLKDEKPSSFWLFAIVASTFLAVLVVILLRRQKSSSSN